MGFTSAAGGASRNTARACPHCGRFYPWESRAEILAGLLLVSIILGLGLAIILYAVANAHQG